MSLTKVIVLILLVLLFWFSEEKIRKKLKISRKKGWKVQHINKLHKWGEISLFTIYLITSFILIVNFDYINIGYLLFAFLIVLHVFRTFMEWKYDKESKEYVFFLRLYV